MTVNTITTQKLQEELDRKGGPTFIDVRRPEELKQGVIPGSKIVDSGNLIKFIEDLDKTRAYILVCQVGFRSEIACKQMLKLGFEDVRNFSDGMKDWYSKNLPLEYPKL